MVLEWFWRQQPDEEQGLGSPAEEAGRTSTHVEVAVQAFSVMSEVTGWTTLTEEIPGACLTELREYLAFRKLNTFICTQVIGLQITDRLLRIQTRS